LQGVAQRLSLLIPRLASDHDGEVVATVRAMQRTLEAARADLHDLAAVVRACGEPPRQQEASRYAQHDDPPDHLTAQNWQRVALWLQRQPGLNDWEVGFLRSIVEDFSTLSAKQHACLVKVWEKMRRRRAAA
jgi:hypothetical protein